MKMSKNKNKRRQQQGGKPVLVTFYVAEPRDRGGSASTATSSHGLGHHDHHHHHKKHRQDHHHSHGDGPDMQRRRRKDGKSQSNRRADLLEYSRKLRASSSARQTAACTATASPTPPPAPPPPPPPRDWDTSTAVGVRRDERQRPPQAAVNRLERAMSQQNIRQRCFGGDDWSWKRLLVLVFPFHRRPRRSNRDGSEKNVNIINQTGRPAALLVGKLTVSSKNRRERSGFLKTLMPSFQKRSR